ncbi:MAG TPA: BTAD domain-containing putative transcriptional regulator [Streptosporangiaceae bacterium]|nr:BTAD domain-containing putative transcriptional regulator [Streptosporangiaceae bacterium]
MQFSILGPLDVKDDHESPVPVSRRLHRLTLSLLLLNAGQPCSVTSLVTALWGDSPPLSPEVSLRSCVYGIRKLLPDGHRVLTHPSGYLIEVGYDELDLYKFRDLVSGGRKALDKGDVIGAEAMLSEALNLWRDPPLADLPNVQERDKLLDQHTEAQDALMDAKLELGQHRQVLTELRSIVTADPLREHAWAQLMTALYRCGARAEALAAYGRLRMTLVTTYGIEPGPELQDLHRQVLADDPALKHLPNRPALQAKTPVGAARWPACQLPASVADFTGRTAELTELLGRLPGDGMAVTVISGMPGGGKTELAVHAAHLAMPAFPDGQLCAWLDDAGQARDSQVVLGELLRGLGVPNSEIPMSRFEREAMYRSVLAGRRVLLLADGASSASQVRPLLPNTPGSAVLVTSRSRLADIDGARIVELGGMLPADSVTMLGRISGRAMVGASAEAAMDIADACGYLPLALRIAGARLADDPDLSVSALATLLASEKSRLDELALGDQSVRARFAAATQPLSGPVRTIFALLAAAGPRDLPGWLIASLLDDPSASAAAPALANAGLLYRIHGTPTADSARGASYRMHPLVRAYAGELLEGANPGVVGAATGRLLASGWLDLANGNDNGMLNGLRRRRKVRA